MSAKLLVYKVYTLLHKKGSAYIYLSVKKLAKLSAREEPEVEVGSGEED